MPTRCASVNYCGTQAPIWLRLDNGQRLPDTFQQTQLTGCSSWSHYHNDDDAVSEYDDCCAMKYPIVVRNCSSYFIYQLQPTEACNMAYCAQLPSAIGNYGSNNRLMFCFTLLNHDNEFKILSLAIELDRKVFFFFRDKETDISFWL